MKTPYSYNTITDFLLSQPLTVDVEIDDEDAGCFPLKCVEFDATVLYIGVHDFSRLSLDLLPTEILIYLNMFLVWMRDSVERERFCVVERFLDSAIVLLFSKRFGSDDPFLDALRMARWMGENDELLFCPDMGIASGRVAAGFAGTPKEFTGSVFGRPVLMAAACSRMKPQGDLAACITFPASEWQQRSLQDVFPALEFDHPEKGRIRQPQTWQLGQSREIDFPGLGKTHLRDIANFIHWMPKTEAREKAREWFAMIKAKGFYKNNS
ncbi:MAG: adenylate cyclase [Geobacteraceae bacterium]|nr:adenylate cyclase [Geobacteraceae bacterium]